AVIAVLLGLVCSGTLEWAVQTFGHLVAGWVFFLGRVLPRIDPDPAEVVVAVVCLAGVTVGCHLFGRWLYPAFRPGEAWRWRWTLRVVGTVVLTFVAGTAAVGIVHQTGWLLASP